MNEIHIRDKGIYIFIAILLIYSVTFIGIAIWRYEHFLYKESGDLLLFEQIVHNTVNGRPFYNNFSRQSHFGDHNSPILGILAPFAIVIPVPYVLYIFTVLSIVISAIPIYLIAREKIYSEFLALLLATGYLMLPAFVIQIYQSFHEINLVLPFLTFAFYFFIKERFYPFISMFAMGLMVKEDVSITLFMFVIYAMIKKRKRQWYAVPAILSITWLIFSIKIIIPFFNTSNVYGIGVGYFSNFGTSLYDIAVNIISNPLNILIEITRPDKLHYLFVLLLPVGFILPFFSPEIIFTIPAIFFNMLVSTNRFKVISLGTASDFISIPRHMSIMPSVFLFIATIYSIKKISSFYPKYSNSIIVGLSLLVVASIAYNDRVLLFRSLYFFEGESIPSVDSIKKILSVIPRDATVKADISIATHLYDRKEVYYNIDSKLEQDYIVIMTRDFVKTNIGELRKYELKSFEKNIYLYKKK